MDDRAVEQAAALEILDEAGNRSVDFFAGRWQGVGDIAVMIPVLVLGKHLDEPHAILHESPRNETASAKIFRGRIINAVHLFGGVAFAGDIHHIGGCSLHARG